ncbi:MAG: hypothetical protein HOI42_14190 [Candidatus Marinimicrobia bacterium]|jgi:hypothetical protein|nr:hypothetical protein [Candidatus Falkowbacteria bacterium]MBT6217901.1 hypothetical protein [Candidatus Neomarinimicrobiota bacterium]MBT7899932.1 hypothetical protein [Candidatus Neomarinimicrobiota bacterium]
MSEIQIEIQEIQHGHGLSFKKGVSDALLGNRDHESSCHETHSASYQRGYEFGEALVSKVASHVKA